MSRSRSAVVQVADEVSSDRWVGARAPTLVQKAVDLREAEPWSSAWPIKGGPKESERSGKEAAAGTFSRMYETGGVWRRWRCWMCRMTAGKTWEVSDIQPRWGPAAEKD